MKNNGLDIFKVIVIFCNSMSEVFTEFLQKNCLTEADSHIDAYVKLKWNKFIS